MSDKTHNLDSILRTKASKELEEEVERELAHEDPDKEEALAKLNDDNS